MTQDLQSVRQAEGVQGANSQITTDLTAVGSALQSGDVATAQSAFATLTQDLGNAQQAQSGSHAYKGHGHHHRQRAESEATGTNLGTDLAAANSALQSAGLTPAQSAFSTLTQDLGINGSPDTPGGSGSIAQVTVSLIRSIST